MVGNHTAGSQDHHFFFSIMPANSRELLCWPTFFMFMQFGVALVLLFTGFVLNFFGFNSVLDLLCCRRASAREGSVKSGPLRRRQTFMEAAHGSSDKFAAMQAQMSERNVLHGAIGELRKHRDWQKMYKQQPLFVSHIRTEENFIKGNNEDPELPPQSPMEIESHYASRGVLFIIFWKGIFGRLIQLVLGSALMAGAIGTFFCKWHGRLEEEDWITLGSSSAGTLMNDFRWLPTLMLSGHLAFYVSRWRNFIFCAWNTEGRLKDMGIIIGGSVKNPNDIETRKEMFKIYRFMVMAMALQYRRIIPALAVVSEDEDFLVCCQNLGLITENEQAVLMPLGSRMRDLVLCWIGREIELCGPDHRNIISTEGYITIMDKLTEMRGVMMFFHGNNFFPQPNLMRAFMMLLIDIYCIIMVFTYPVRMLTPLQHTIIPGLQEKTIVTTFVMTLCFWGCEVLINALAKPFDKATKIDTFNIDSLIAGTEQTLFASMRGSFDDTARNA